MWLLFAFIMFVASNALYLLIRLAQKQSIHISFYSIFMFSVPCIIYFAVASLTRTSLLLAWPHFLLVMAAAFLWSYLGNLFSQKAILLAPNPGYSLILQKSYVVLTTIAAVFFFDAEFSWQKFTAILAILLFALMISSAPKNQKLSDSRWVVFSILTNLCFAFGSLISKHFLNLGLEPFVYLFYTNLFVSILSFFDFRRQKMQVTLTNWQWLLMIAIGISGAIFNFSMQSAYKTAPNIGYVSGINVASIMSVTFLSALIFKDSLSRSKIIGIAGVFVGLLFLIF